MVTPHLLYVQMVLHKWYRSSVTEVQWTQVQSKCHIMQWPQWNETDQN